MRNSKLFIALFVSICLFFFLKGMDSNVSSVRVTIQQEESLMTVANQLKEQKVIQFPFLFVAYATLQGKDTAIQPGTFLLETSTPYHMVLNTITNPQESITSVKVVIPEGFTVEAIADRLAKHNIVEKEDFLKAANNAALIPKEYEDWFPQKQEVSYVFEGYLYPDTYWLHEKMTGEQVIATLFQRFVQVINTIEKPKHISMAEWVILASIIEKEAALVSEQKAISGVFYNRIKEGWKLESCATIQYALPERKQQLLLEDLQIETPYNTYRYKGLPVGAIGNAGKQAFFAASNPEKHSYFFFVTKKDGTNAHYFSETLEEHQQYTDKSGNE